MYDIITIYLSFDRAVIFTDPIGLLFYTCGYRMSRIAQREVRIVRLCRTERNNIFDSTVLDSL